MNLFLWIRDKSTHYKLQTLALSIGYPLIDITDKSDKASVVVSDDPGCALSFLKEGKYVILYLSQTQASKVPSIPRELKFRFRMFVIKPKNLRAAGESPALGRLMAHLVQLAQKLNIS